MLDVNNLLGASSKSPQKSMIRLQGLAAASTNTLTRTWTNVVAKIGNDVQYIKDSALGDSFVAVVSGLYLIYYSDVPAAGVYSGLTLNGNPTGGASTSQTTAQILACCLAGAGVTAANPITVPVWLNQGDVIRCQTNTAALGGDTPTHTFIMVKVL